MSVAERRDRAERKVAALRKKGKDVHPISVEGRTIATTYWGKAWCNNLESYSDFSNRLPRGRSYLRHGSVLDLQVKPGEVKALVAGRDLYAVKVCIKPVKNALWKSLAAECARHVDSVLELLEGKLSRAVMDVLARRGSGLFPEPAEISLDCSCPDWADMCKHVSAVLYGIGARLDEDPEFLFVLRGVDHMDLIATAGGGSRLTEMAPDGKTKVLDDSSLSDVFGIELEETTPTSAKKKRKGVARGKVKPGKVKPGKVKPGKAKRKRTQRKAARGATITTQDLLDRGVPRSTFKNWVKAGVLRRTSRRGVYKTTATTEERIAKAGS